MKNIQKELANIKKGNYAPIYLILGKERYLIERFQKTLIQQALNEESIDLNFSIFDMKEHTVNDALFEASSFPFFGERKVVFVQNPYFLTGKKIKNAPNHNIDKLEDYINNPAEFTILVLFAPYEKLDRRKRITKSLEKNAQIIDASSPYANETNRYIKEVIKEKGYYISDEAFQLFIERTDGKLTEMMHELDKLFLYHTDSKKITKDSIRYLVSKSLEQNVFELNNLVLNQQVEASIEAYHDLLIQREEPIKIVALLISQFRLLLQVKILQKQGYSQGNIAKVLKVHPYRVKLAIKNVGQHKQELLSEALNYLIDADYKMKAGQIDQELQIEIFIMRFAQQNKVYT